MWESRLVTLTHTCPSNESPSQGECDDTVVGDGVVLPMQIVCVGKPACSHVFCLGVVGIGGSLFGPCSFGLFLSLFSFNLVFSLFARSSIGVILLTMMFFSLCLSLIERLEASALLNNVLFC